MFEGLKLNKELVEYQNQRLKEKVSNLSDEHRKKYYSQLAPVLKDHDTYAVLNYLLVAGLHHFYLGKIFRGMINLTILTSGIGLICFTDYIFVGSLLIIFILIIELLALFRSQVIVMNHNNHLAEEILESVSKV